MNTAAIVSKNLRQKLRRPQKCARAQISPKTNSEDKQVAEMLGKDTTLKGKSEVNQTPTEAEISSHTPMMQQCVKASNQSLSETAKQKLRQKLRRRKSTTPKTMKPAEAGFLFERAKISSAISAPAAQRAVRPESASGGNQLRPQPAPHSTWPM